MSSVAAGAAGQGEWQNDKAAVRLPHICFLLPGLSAGGAERVVNILANRLVETGWTVTLVTLAAPGEAPYYQFAPEVSVVGLGLPPAPRGRVGGMVAAIRRVLKIRQAFGKANPDVIVSFLTRTNILALIAMLGTGVPIIISERNNPELQTVGAIWAWLRRRLYPRAFGLVTITQGAMDWYPRSPRQKQWVIPNPVMVPPMGPRRRHAHKTIVAVGRLVPQKGFDLLLEAWARIAADCPEWRLVIWGEGEERKVLEAQIARLGLADRVALPGLTPTPGGWAVEADLFVLSSRFEGWGNALAEALSVGIPSISFDCDWGPGVLVADGQNGLLVPPGDVAGLAEGLRRLMADAGLRARLGKAAQQSMVRYTPDAILAEWKQAIDAGVRAARHR
ncbi:glycosyltransferase family 4 protein [Sphingomonas sp. C3-2]|uniref:glycosyltransferase family 4 protein n=1 Tax=Sphingomonas sp. C3-2 TaxID=3062169 RepID=UPI00294AC88A|nr:glycosyltransferase family 4 protein [Sphingomonas sp. C3-2]WOK38045.1 glycosyltransferase family 4 protein [Sphingomonas sp. C3-2]